MKALKYKVTVQDDPVHQYTKRTIQEVWVPSCKICFNEENFTFESEEPRIPEKECEEISIPPYWGEVLQKYIDKKSEIKVFCEKIFLTSKE